LAGSQGYKHPPDDFIRTAPHAVEIVEDPAAVTAGTVRIQISGPARTATHAAQGIITRVTAPVNSKYPHDAVKERL
jgi:hypothetical protein